MQSMDLSIDKMIEDVIAMINIPSVYNVESSPMAPFGESVMQSLESALELGRKLGFTTKNYDGYAGEINIGTGDYIVGVLCHVDVVAAGDGWNTEAFEGCVKEGKIFGRGALDDKGPMVACLYAMRRLLEENKIPEGVTIRMILGTNEEELWQGIEYYLKNVDVLPDVSIVPDAMFPAVYCEKGLYDVNLMHHEYNSNSRIKLVDLNAGVGRNIVCSKANCRLALDETIDVNKILDEVKEYIAVKNIDGTVHQEEKELTINIVGKGAHAMTPEKGINAFSQLMRLLSVFEKNEFSHGGFVNYYVEKLDDYTGEKAGFACEDKDSGILTFNVGTARLLDEKIMMEVNIRYPASFQFTQIENKVMKSFSKVYSIEKIEHLMPVYFERDSSTIQKIVKAYQEVTGDYENEPISMGGATYARAIPNAIAVGGTFPYEEELAHEANEFISIDSLVKASEIYYNILLSLMDYEMEEI